MNHYGFCRIGFALALTVAPLTSEAANRQAGLEACADALLNELGNASGAVVRYQEDTIARPNSRLNQREVFHLDARDATSDEVVARVDCRLDARANVLRIDTLPLDAEDAEERAVSLN